MRSSATGGGPFEHEGVIAAIVPGLPDLAIANAAVYRDAATLGSALALKGLVVLAIAGFGYMPGVIVGGLAVGLVEAFAARYLGGEFANLAVFTMLIVVLLARPAGLFVRAKERTV